MAALQLTQKSDLLAYLLRWKRVSQVVRDEIRRSTTPSRYLAVKVLWSLNAKLQRHSRKKPESKNSFVNPHWIKLRQPYLNE